MEDAPAYFKSFLKLFESNSKGLKEEMSALRTETTALRTEVAGLKTMLENQRDKLDSHLVEFDALKTHVAQIEASIGAPTSLPLTDSRELLFTGIPATITASRSEIVGLILEAIGLPNYSAFITSLRDWLPRSTPRRETDAAPTLSFVAKCVSPSARDDILLASNKLKDIDNQALFRMGGGTHIFIRALWPKQIHELHTQAIAAAKKLNYARPIVANLSVFMRRTRESNLIPIRSIKDLESLTPHAKQ